MGPRDSGDTRVFCLSLRRVLTAQNDCTLALLLRRREHVLRRRQLAGLHHEPPRQAQRPGLARRPRLGGLDGLQVSDVCNTYDPPDHLAARKPEGVGPQCAHVLLLRLLQRRGPARRRGAEGLRPRSLALPGRHSLPPACQELRSEHSPRLGEARLDPGALRAPRRPAGLEAVEAEEAQQEVAEERADVEAHRAVEGELGVYAERAGGRHHHAASVQVAVQQRLAALHEAALEGTHGRLEANVRTEPGGGLVEVRGGVAVVGGVVVWLCEDDRLRELAHRLVGPELHRRLPEARSPECEGRGLEQRRGEEVPHVLGEHRERLPLDQQPPQYGMRRLDVAHRHDPHRLVAQEHLRDVLRAQGVRRPQGLHLVLRALL
mmetsp:Transcript_19122/g.65093  ORF Transcript_19122/g.65093 Transcript_19122/m.65093 type:complete len:376 (-) Transcript_19122:258-1385(-)